jgi:acetoin utilization protein AcuC
MRKVGVAYGDALLQYSFGIDHPMNFNRIRVFYRTFDSEFKDSPKMNDLMLVEPVMADENIIGLFHTKDYIEYVRKASINGYGFLDYGDTPAYKGVFEASEYVVGTSIECAELIMRKEVGTAFNPMGGLHHAKRDSAAGFCVFNDVGVVIEYLRKKYSIKSFLYVDIDAHHGDGVFYEFLEDKNVWIVDVHEDWRTLYPGTGKEEERGEGAALGTKINIVLPAGSDDKIFYSKFENAKDFISNINPEFIIFQCGGDSLKGDPLTHLNLTPKVHADVADFLKKLSIEKKCYGPLAVGGGGYNNITTSQAWINVINSFLKGDL